MNSRIATTFSVATYNILAQAYTRPRRYPNSPRLALDRHARRHRLLDRIARLDADILCLQEVERDAYSAIATRLADSHDGVYEQKRGKPDGAAVFVRRAAAELLERRALHYAAHEPGDDQLALITRLRVGGRALAVACTHLRWQPRETVAAAHLGRRQLLELLDQRAARGDADETWIIAGDLNATSDSVVLRAALDRGYRLSCRSQRPWDTTNINGRPRKIDYLLRSHSDLSPSPCSLPRLARDAVMPSLEEPSDHLALRVDFAWRA